MKCDFVKRKVYELFNSNIKQLDDEIIRHIDNCPNCNAHYEESKIAKKITSSLNQLQPVLNNPHELTNNILAALYELEQKKNSASIRFFTITKRLLAAASIFLIVVFGYEQYIIVEKLIKLEQQISTVPGIPVNSPHYQEILSYYPKQGAGFIKTGLTSSIIATQDNDLKSRFMIARLGRLSSEVVSKRLLDQLVLLRISNEELNIINSIKNELENK